MDVYGLISLHECQKVSVPTLWIDTWIRPYRASQIRMVRLFLHGDLLVCSYLCFTSWVSWLACWCTRRPWRFVDGQLLVYTGGFSPIHRDSSGGISMTCLILPSNLQVSGILYHWHPMWHPSQTRKVKWNTTPSIIAIDIEVTWGQFQISVTWWNDQLLTTSSSNIGINSWWSHTLQVQHEPESIWDYQQPFLKRE